MPSSRDIPNPGIKPRSPTLQVDSLLSELPGKPKKTGMGSLSLLQGKFLTQESNWGLLYCRRILYSVNQVRSVQFSSVAQSCPTLCDPLDCSLPGSSAWGFSRQEYWRGLPCPSPRDLPNPGIDPRSPTFQTGFFTDQATREAPKYWSG